MKYISLVFTLTTIACSMQHQGGDTQEGYDVTEVPVRCFLDPGLGLLCPSSDAGFFIRAPDAAQEVSQDARVAPDTMDPPDAGQEAAASDLEPGPEAGQEPTPEASVTVDTTPEASVQVDATPEAGPVCLNSQGANVCANGTCENDPAGGGSWCCLSNGAYPCAGLGMQYCPPSSGTCVDIANGHSNCCFRITW